MTNLFYDIYLPNVTASMLMTLSLICLLIPYAYRVKNKIIPKSKNVKYTPNISKDIWNPIVGFIVFNLFLYNIFILRFFFSYDTPNHIIKYICLILICWSLLYTIFGFILMFDFVDRAYNVWNFKAIMWLLFAVSFIRFTIQYISNPKNEIYVLYLYTFVCIALLILMSLLIKEFKYYIIT